MTLEEVMKQLEQMGTEQTKNTFMRHGAQEPFFGVKVGDMKKLVKFVKKDQELAQSLYETDNSDAMYLAGLTVNPKIMTKEKIQQWVKKAKWYMISEYTIAWIAAESPFAVELAMEWINTDDEMIATAGWSTYANYVSITPDDLLDIDQIQSLLERVKHTIHNEKNRVRYTMNNFVICVGSYVSGLHHEAISVSKDIGKVHVNVGQTACKVPLAHEYIHKVEVAGKIGVKKKNVCLLVGMLLLLD